MVAREPEGAPSPTRSSCLFGSGAGAAPHLFGDLDDHAQLGPLLVLGKRVALLRGGKAALRREAELVEMDVFAGLVNPALDVVLLLKNARLGGYKAQYDGLALRQEAQGLEASGTVRIPFHEIAIDRHAVEENLRDRLVSAGRDEGRAEIAAAQMHGDRQIVRLVLERLAHHAGIDLWLLLRIVAALAQHLALLGVA